MAAAGGAEVVVAVVSAPPPPPPKRVLFRRRPMPATVKALLYLFLASLWVASAGLFFAVIAGWAWGSHSAVITACLMTTSGSTLFVVLLLVVLAILLLRSLYAVAMEHGFCTLAKEFRREVSGASIWDIPLDSVLLATLVSIPFILLLMAGLLVFKLPVEMSQRERIGNILCDVGLFGITGISCFFAIPVYAMKLWKTY